jgi:hypothetical protein
MLLSDRDDAAQTLPLDRAHPTFGEGVQIGTSGRQFDALYTGGLQDRDELSCEHRITVMDQVARVSEEALAGISKAPSENNGT